MSQSFSVFHSCIHTIFALLITAIIYIYMIAQVTFAPDTEDNENKDHSMLGSSSSSTTSRLKVCNKSNKNLTFGPNTRIIYLWNVQQPRRLLSSADLCCVWSTSWILIICDMIKMNESDVGHVIFEILAKTVFKFLCFILFVALTNSS